jgi:hypothetical protein
MSVAVRVCSVDDCSTPVKARGWCSTHYSRWRTHGDPLVTVYSLPTVWFCECAVPALGGFGECQVCFRKPRALMVGAVRCHEICFDDDGHSDGCLYDGDGGGD